MIIIVEYNVMFFPKHKPHGIQFLVDDLLAPWTPLELGSLGSI
jgi:hypothetical protein